jgi:hypothetical protein
VNTTLKPTNGPVADGITLGTLLVFLAGATFLLPEAAAAFDAFVVGLAVFVVFAAFVVGLVVFVVFVVVLVDFFVTALAFDITASLSFPLRHPLPTTQTHPDALHASFFNSEQFVIEDLDFIHIAQIIL